MVPNNNRLATLFVLFTLAIATMTLGTFALHHTTDDAETQAVSYLRVAHLGPDAPAVDVHLDNETVVTNASFGNVSPYLAVAPGTHNVSITLAGDNTSVVSEQNVTLEPRGVFTVAASGEVAGDENDTFGLRIFSDNALKPSPNSSALRIIHLSPDAGNVTLTIDNGSTTLAENLTEGESVDYLTVAPGNYTVEIREPNGMGNGTVLATANISIEGGQAITAWAIGYFDPVEDQQPFAIATTEDAVASLTFPTEETPTPNATESSPTETEAPATETEAPPTETETTPTATESSPTETEAPPTATETSPTETETSPTATETPPTATVTTPTVPEIDPTPTES